MATCPSTSEDTVRATNVQLANALGRRMRPGKCASPARGRRALSVRPLADAARKRGPRQRRWAVGGTAVPVRDHRALLRRGREVWSVRDANGFPAPENADGRRAMPFWSKKSRAGARCQHRSRLPRVRRRRASNRAPIPNEEITNAQPLSLAGSLRPLTPYQKSRQLIR